MYWRCTNHTAGCMARILSKNNVVNEITTEHNHPDNSVVDETTNADSKPTIDLDVVKKEVEVKKALNLKEHLKMKLAKSFQLK